MIIFNVWFDIISVVTKMMQIWITGEVQFQPFYNCLGKTEKREFSWKSCFHFCVYGPPTLQFNPTYFPGFKSQTLVFGNSLNSLYERGIIWKMLTFPSCTSMTIMPVNGWASNNSWCKNWHFWGSAGTPHEALYGPITSCKIPEKTNQQNPIKGCWRWIHRTLAAERAQCIPDI